MRIVKDKSDKIHYVMDLMEAGTPNLDIEGCDCLNCRMDRLEKNVQDALELLEQIAHGSPGKKRK